MTRKPNILVAVFNHPVERGNVTVVDVPYRGQSIPELKAQLKIPESWMCVVDNKKDGRIKIGSKSCFSCRQRAWAAVWELITAIAWAAAITVGVYYITQGTFRAIAT